MKFPKLDRSHVPKIPRPDLEHIRASIRAGRYPDLDELAARIVDAELARTKS
jgi:hypothetical protein